MRREKKEKLRKNLEVITDFFNMTERQRKLERALERMNRRKREQAMINEQVKKFVARGGRVKQINPIGRDIEDIICHGSQLDAIEFLEA